MRALACRPHHLLSFSKARAGRSVINSSWPSAHVLYGTANTETQLGKQPSPPLYSGIKLSCGTRDFQMTFRKTGQSWRLHYLRERWLPPEDDGEPQIQPTPAAAPSLTRNGKPNYALQGALKLVVNQSNTNYYVKRAVSGFACDLTADTNEALRVRCDSWPSPTVLRWPDHLGHSWLAAHWNFSNPVIGEGSTLFARLRCLDSDDLKPAWGANTPFQLLTCTVLANGEVIPVWRKNATTGPGRLASTLPEDSSVWFLSFRG